MSICCKIIKNVLIVKLNGELDHNEATIIREEIDNTLQKSNLKNLVLDFSEVTYMDSGGISVILGRYRKLCQLNGNVIIVSCNRNIRTILSLSGIFTIIDYMDDAEKAVACIGKVVI